MDGSEYIDLVYTGSNCHLGKPRILLGGLILRWMHGTGSGKTYRSFPCLRDYALPCKPCGVQTEYAYLSAAMIETSEERVQSQADNRRQKWAALPESERRILCETVRQTKPMYRTLSPEMVETAAMVALWPPEQAEQLGRRLFPGRRILQCVPGAALRGIDLHDADKRRGLVVKITNSAGRVKIGVERIIIDPVPADFDPAMVFDRRYGLHRLRRQAVEQNELEHEERPAVLPFRKAE